MCHCPAVLQVAVDVLQVDLHTGLDSSTVGRVQHLAQWFPQFSDSVLQQVLIAVGGDISAAAEELVVADADADKQTLPDPIMVTTCFRMSLYVLFNHANARS